MQAILMTQTGDAADVLQISDISTPEITQNSDVKIKIKAAGINPIDIKVRRNGGFYSQSLPIVLGCDGAGVVVEVGKAVTDFKLGDEVWFCHGGLGKEQGTYAEYTVIDSRWLVLKPKSLSFVEAAALPLILITAWGALFDKGQLQSGQTVLIHGGAGGVGHVAIQLAKFKGAKVITTVSSDEKASFVKSLGADYIINYRADGFVDTVNEITVGVGADLVIDTIGSDVFKDSIAATAYFGRLITLLDPGELSLSEARLRNLMIGFELMLTPILKGLDQARDQHMYLLNQCNQLIEQGLLRVKVSDVFTLEQAAIAQAKVEQGHTLGKVVLEIIDNGLTP